MLFKSLNISTNHTRAISVFLQVSEQERQYNEHRSKLEEIEGQINNLVSEMQKMETRNSKNRDNYEKMKADVRLMTEELKNLQKSQPGKVFFSSTEFFMPNNTLSILYLFLFIQKLYIQLIVFCSNGMLILFIDILKATRYCTGHLRKQ